MVKKELTEQLIGYQMRIDRDRRQYELNAWMHLNLSIGQLKSLFFISNRGATSLSKLAAALRVTPTNTTGIVDRLLKRGLITRTVSPDDRRVLLLRTTTRGDELIAELRQKRKERMAELFNHLTDKEAAIVADALNIMVKVIETYREETAK
jgi:DNA-binding MarR family transcriptional regulator